MFFNGTVFWNFMVWNSSSTDRQTPASRSTFTMSVNKFQKYGLHLVLLLLDNMSL